MSQSSSKSPRAEVTLRAYRPAPAAIELSYQPLPGRLLRTVGSLVVFWGAIPVLIWVPPHYPWVTLSFIAGLYLAHRSWKGRYRVYSFAGICPRCGHPVSLDLDHAISLPHALTCYHCHFEPRLEVRFDSSIAIGLAHQNPDCSGIWETRWLADEPFLVCDRCHAGAPASEDARRVADEENDRARLLSRLTREGEPLI